MGGYSCWSTFSLGNPVDAAKTPEDGMHDVEVTFDEPGTYVLWGRADDGGLYDDAYITVNVTE